MDNIAPRQKNESLSAYRARIRKAKGLGTRKRGSAKAQNKRDRPDKAASGICLVCGKNRLKCICSGHMSEAAMHRFTKEQKQRPTPEQAGFG